MLDSYISALCRYAERTGLLQPEDLVFARNALLEALQLDSFDEAAAPAEASLADILQVLTGDAVARGVCAAVPAGFVPLRRDRISGVAGRPAGS